MRVFSDGLIIAQKARLQVTKALTHHGLAGNAPMPDLPTKTEAQAYIGLGMKRPRERKQRFIDNIVPKWIDNARKNHQFVTKPM